MTITEALTAQMAVGDAAPVGEEFDSVVDQLGESDPRLAAVLRFMHAQQAAVDAFDDVDLDEPVDPLADRRLRRRSARIRRSVERLLDEVSSLRARNDDLAAALGACFECWGDDPRCRECQGDGAPGWAAPDPELFVAYVEPAIPAPAAPEHQIDEPMPDAPPRPTHDPQLTTDAERNAQ